MKDLADEAYWTNSKRIETLISENQKKSEDKKMEVSHSRLIVIFTLAIPASEVIYDHLNSSVSHVLIQVFKLQSQLQQPPQGQTA